MNYTFLSETNLFRGIAVEELKDLLTCLGAHEKSYKKGSYIYTAGEHASEVGLVESGSVNIVVNFFRGNSNIFGHVGCGKIFAETYAAIPDSEMRCDVVAAENCEILFLNMNRMLTSCSNGCAFHQRLVHNLLRISASKNLHMSSRMMHIAPKSIRDRLLSYFSEQVLEKGTRVFEIPFSRQQLADYLSVDRSALSNELSKMQKEGLIAYQKNTFTLLAEPEF